MTTQTAAIEYALQQAEAKAGSKFDDNVRAAFGPGVDVTDVVTGQRYRT